MASQTIKLLPDNYYHIYTRGNNKENLFRQKDNYKYFLSLWQKHLTPIAYTQAYCLMPNHIHFCIKVRHFEDLSEKFQNGSRLLSQPISNCFNAYTKAFNKRFSRTGSLFQRPYQRKLVDSELYLLQLIVYIHTNPPAPRLL